MSSVTISLTILTLVLRCALPSMQWVGTFTTYDPPGWLKYEPATEIKWHEPANCCFISQPIRRVIHSSLQRNYLLPRWIWCCRSVKQTICFLSQSEWPYCAGVSVRVVTSYITCGNSPRLNSCATPSSFATCTPEWMTARSHDTLSLMRSTLPRDQLSRYQFATR